MEEQLRAYAKINLTLDVLYRRDDGYHALQSLMQSVSLYDTVTLEPASGITVHADVPLPPDNTAARAAQLYKEHGGGGARIYISKRIPSEAGLGGASADAAAVLRGLQRLYGALEPAALFSIARQVGADVPFCLLGGCALAEGIGERLTPLASHPFCFLLVKGTGGISTAALFHSLWLPVAHPRTQEAMRALQSGDARALGPLLQNALEPAAAARVEEIAAYKARLLEQGALGAAMTGSGSAVFGLFPGPEEARRAASAFADADFVRVVNGVTP